MYNGADSVVCVADLVLDETMGVEIAEENPYIRIPSDSPPSMLVVARRIPIGLAIGPGLILSCLTFASI